MSETHKDTDRRKGSQETRATSDALEIIQHRVGDDAELAGMIEHATIDAIVAKVIHEARADAGLTQAELASMVGTPPAVIEQLEDADYEGHSLYMLKHIGDALGKRLEIRLVDPVLRQSA